MCDYAFNDTELECSAILKTFLVLLYNTVLYMVIS